MLYRSIRLGVSYVLLAALMVVLPAYAQQEQKADTPGTTDPKLEEMKKLKEQFQACEQELDRLFKKLLDGGIENPYTLTSSDRNMQETCGAASAAFKANGFAGDPSPELKNRVKPELIEGAKETSLRMLAEFRQKGINASFSSSDRDQVRIFLGVVAAVTVLQLADSPAATKDVDPAVVEAAKTNAAAMVLRFNESGYRVSFSSWEVTPLERFLSKVEVKNK